MIKPTIGRVMWYWPRKDYRGDQPWAAIVTYVHSDNMVNLTTYNADGHNIPASSVPVVQDGSPFLAGDSPYVEWMPYQIGQAKKHEAEDKIS
jgi:ribulose-5-phosphate 4-epimerase/fuculose-1-phosphate aldolase